MIDDMHEVYFMLTHIYILTYYQKYLVFTINRAPLSHRRAVLDLLFFKDILMKSNFSVSLFWFKVKLQPISIGSTFFLKFFPVIQYVLFQSNEQEKRDTCMNFVQQSTVLRY